jgi:hypothetical protein
VIGIPTAIYVMTGPSVAPDRAGGTAQTHRQSPLARGKTFFAK